MSNRNDEIFAKFMVLLAKKIVDRRNQLVEHIEALKAGQFVFSALAGSPSLSIIGFDPAGKSITRNDVTEAEVEVMRAYFNGEDVLTTILSQER
ncbi:hypothetical protein JZX86_27595 [Agrobacterium rosae]|uniref:hypothetical protein n=1 Tax=Agrobacterium rosae TaxID=1972867 RepID=UPI0019D36C51|nr:hypothetical protein [Agrobacterium rosae]MBN7809087.1 hypothetical protein [Agrobacterium rosae]